MALNLMILARDFALNPEDVREGVTYRYAGLYGSLTKTLLKRSPESKVFWYSVTDHSLRIITKQGYKDQKASMISALRNAVFGTLRSKSYLTVIIAYPSVLPRVSRIFEYVSCLLFFKLFSFPQIRVFVDAFDYQVEAAYDFSETAPSFMLVNYYRLLDKLSFSFASSIVVLSEFWKNHIMKIYHLQANKILVVTSGSLLRFIPHKLKDQHGTFIVLYAGSTMKCKDIDKLVLAIANLRAKGLKIDLHIAGIKVMDVPSWVNIAHYEWSTLVRDILPRSDVCVIPYSSSKFAFNHSVPAKLFDYMAAGKPIVSTNLEVVGNIIRSYCCGLVAKDWTEFELHLEHLYENRELATKLGNNGRIAAEKYFDYEKLAEFFLEDLVNQYCDKQRLE